MLEVEGLEVSYRGNCAVDGISLSIAAGEVVALIGANGAGKSSVLKALMGLVPAASKRLDLDGSPIAGLPTRRRIQGGLALSPEGRAVFPRMSVDENLSLGRPGGGHEEDRNAIRRMFPRLSERATQAAGTLSGGEQQMLAIGRALMARPRLLLLDEPTLGLAPVIVQEIGRIIDEVRAAGTAVLVAEQNALAALGWANRAYVLTNGSVTMQGDAADLIDNEEVRRAYLGV
ncbi:ABC transporter ATP-binding protein [Nitratireductor alexandrii]|uniref:ABC transporter ATP-binding protein n=1 Tax=Nitratireductor alexandrii TaxID=2448161 RepID=UPI000FD8A8DA|nr:ABC transporter ATP-binding protein [Nitratireductor alexandrii]